MRTEPGSRFVNRMAKRSRFAWVLTLLMSALYLTFLYVIAFKPEMLSASSSFAPLFWGLGLILLLASFVLAGLYFKRASQDYENLNAEMLSHLTAHTDMRPGQDRLMPDARI